MALSLREKLKSAVPIEKKETPRAQDCLTRTEKRALSGFDLPDTLNGEALALMQGDALSDVKRNSVLFLDTETTGLSGGAGTIAFLVGVGYFDEDCFRVEQYLMRDYDEEAFVLKKVAQRISERPVVCTFNGQTFDLPLLASRFTMQRMRFPDVDAHVDLLHAARRVWKLRLKRCNLSALEEQVLGVQREGDLPGSLVPQRYFSFLKTRDFSLLEDVLRHNAQDVVSLADLLSRLIALHLSPLSAPEAEDVYSLGRIYEKRGQTEGARRCYRAVKVGEVALLSQKSLAESYRRSGEYAQAAQTYEQTLLGRGGDAATHIALAKIYEHRMRDYPSALRHTRQAMLLCAEKDDPALPLIQKRYQRIMTKLRRN